MHLACHGLIDTRYPLRSSLALTPAAPDDGRLTATEVIRLGIDADLAVLSACGTGRGQRLFVEGLMGFNRSFMLSGTPRVLTSLWNVDDESTHALMVKFYDYWNPKDGSRGLRASAALKKAQEDVKKDKRWAHPYYWAAWVLWGIPE